MYDSFLDDCVEYQCIHPMQVTRVSDPTLDPRDRCSSMCKVCRHTILKVTTFLNEISPALYFSTRILYMPIGEEPVGRPRTKGWSGVGPKALIRSSQCQLMLICSARGGNLPTMYCAT